MLPGYSHQTSLGPTIRTSDVAHASLAPSSMRKLTLLAALCKKA